MELLVAMSVTILLIFLLMKVFTATSNTWIHGEAQVDAYREARGALQIMARDLSATLQPSYAPATTTTTTSATPTSGPLLPTLLLQRYPGATVDTGPQNEEVYCLTNIPNNGSSSLCAVGYYCQWMPDLASGDAQTRAPRAFALMRQFLDSNGTFQRIKAATPPPPTLTPLGFQDLYARTGTAPVARYDQLAAYIWDLRFRIDTDLNETTSPDGNALKVPKDHSTPPLYYDGSTPYPPSLPPYVEIRFKALSATAGRRLENQNVTQADWKDTDPTHTSSIYQSVILPNAQQFVLRVPLAYTTPTSTPLPSP